MLGSCMNKQFKTNWHSVCVVFLHIFWEADLKLKVCKYVSELGRLDLCIVIKHNLVHTNATII